VASNQIFSATLLQSNDMNTLESFESDSTIRDFPDIELVAAMKRINLLQERTEAIRPEHEKLSISISELSLDRIKSTRSTGTYASAPTP
jgi:hypothetical protein